MSSIQNYHLTFTHQAVDYDVNLIKDGHSDHLVTINGLTYAVLSDNDKLKTVSDILNSVPLDSVSSERELKERLSVRGDISFTQSQKVDALSKEIFITATEIAKVVNDISESVINQYFDRNVGKECSEFIQKRRSLYENIKTAKELAETLTQDLREVSKDLHFAIQIKTNEPQPVESPDDRLSFLEEVNFGFPQLETPENGVSYLEVWGLEDPRELLEGKQLTLEKVKNIMRQIKEAHPKAIILDLTLNGGGSPHMVQLLSSYFLPPDISLNTMEYRNKPEYEKEGEYILKNNNKQSELTYRVEYRTLPLSDISLEDRMLDTPLYILTSRHTFSGAEEFANNFKELKTAIGRDVTIVGEATGGGAHPCQLYSAGSLFAVAVPMGEAINPYSHKNWEGTGVLPDVKTEFTNARAKAEELIQVKI